MGKFANTAVMDNGLNYVKTNTHTVCLCQGEPTNYDEATKLISNNGKMIASISIVSTDFTLADAAALGRKLIVPEKSGIQVNLSGTLDHIALVCDTLQQLLFVTNITNAQIVYNGNTVTIPSWEITIAAPV